MLSLIELQNKKVEAKRKKYEKDEMDAYLELVFDNYKQLTEENAKLTEQLRNKERQMQAERDDLTSKIKTLSDGVQYYRSIETTLQKALILAEKTSKETKDAAILKAESIVNNLICMQIRLLTMPRKSIRKSAKNRCS